MLLQTHIIARAEVRLSENFTQQIRVPTRLFCHSVFENHKDQEHPYGQWSIAIEFIKVDEYGHATVDMSFVMDAAPHEWLRETSNKFTLYYGTTEIGKGTLFGVINEPTKQQ